MPKPAKIHVLSTLLGALLVTGCANGEPADPYCGDGNVDPRESCDDGNLANGDGCSSECIVEASLCGNGNIDISEQCDDGNTNAGDGCAADCTLEPGPECGDGTTDALEECDDGNTDDCDGCSAICRLEACGNGSLECDEQCDDANTNDGDGCAADCTEELITVCGDGAMEGSEGCDDGNTDDCDGCSASCMVEACGNGVLECAEGCDDSNTDDGDGCAADCTVEVPPGCGNGVLESPEECDDGNTVSGDGCQANCMNPTCGDGSVDTGEACDDGNTVDGDGCSASCDVESYGHTITVDGSNDFGAGESLSSGTASFTGYVAWDTTNLYVGFLGADVGSNSSQRWLLVYLSGGSNTMSTGVTYNTQVPSLPFAASHHLRWRTDDLYTDLMENNGTTWSSTTWSGAAARNGNFVELSVPWTDIGSPSTVALHLSMINEENMSEWSWAAVPASSFSDGYDPAYTSYYEFDLASGVEPGSYTPLP